MKMKQVISSNATLFYKYVFPVLWIGLFGYVVSDVLMGSESGDLWLFALLWVVGAVFTLLLASRLKFVSVDERAIYASGYVRKEEIPLSDIISIEESSGVKPKQVTLRLRSPSAFGRKIVFIPELRVFETWRVNHPVIAELNTRIKAGMER